MSKLSDLFGRKGGETGSDKAPGRSNGNGNGKHHDQIPPFAAEAFPDVGSRLGEENEELRNLLFDTGRKIGELDELKSAFDKIVTPFNNTLRALEQEKSQNLSLNQQLGESRATADTLRAQFYSVEKKATLLETQNERLREDLELAREQVRGLESQRNEINNQVSNQNAQIAELERQLAQET
jgi:chromosome segregation ATPase